MIATALILLLVLIGISIPVGAALGVLGLLLDPLFSMLPLSRALGELSWSTSNEFLPGRRSRCSSCSARSCCARASPSACTRR